MKPIQNNLKAFTLIEALITVAIISIATAVMLVNYSNTQATQRLESSAREVEAAVREIQGYALTGYQDVAGSDPCRFEISWTAGSPTYNLNYYYKDQNTDACGPQSPIATYSLRNGVTFGSTGSFYFIPPWAVIYPQGSNKTIMLNLSGSSHVVCIDEKSGRIDNWSGGSCT